MAFRLIGPDTGHQLAAEVIFFAAEPEQIGRLALSQLEMSPLRHWSDQETPAQALAAIQEPT